MARKIKRFFVFLFFSLFFTLLSGRVSTPVKSGKKDQTLSENKTTKTVGWALNVARAEEESNSDGGYKCGEADD